MQDDNTQDIIKTRFQQLPPELQKAITAADLPTKFDIISKKFGLRIDQSGSLQTETVLIMLGLESSDDFINNLAENAEISKELARSIAEEVNAQILNDIRSYLRQMESQQEITENETAEKVSTSAVSDRKTIISSIENPESHPNLPINVLTSVPSPEPANAPVGSASAPLELMPNASEQQAAPAQSSLINRLMSAPAATNNEVVEKGTAAVIPASPSVKSTPGGIDPYREPIE